MDELERGLPSSDEAEKIILGAILIDNATITQTLGQIQADDFYSPTHKRIFAAMLTLFEEQKPIQPVLIGEELKRHDGLESIGGVSTIMSLMHGVPMGLELDDYIKLIKDTSCLRTLVRQCNSIISHALSLQDPLDDVLETAEAKLYSVREGTSGSEVIELSNEVGQSIVDAKERAASGSAMIGIPSGFVSVDNRLQGFRNGHQIIVAARPSVGKTALAVRIGYHTAVKHNIPTLLVELEMSREEIADRIICAEANIDSYLLRAGHLSESQWQDAEAIRQRLSDGSPFYIMDSPDTTVRSIRSEIRRLNTELTKRGREKIGLVIIDHIGLVSNEAEKKGRNREGEVSEISRNLKKMAKSFKIPILTLSQLNRQSEGRADHRPYLSDLRESGAIEQDADVVVLLYREDQYQTDPTVHNNMAEVIIAKNRNGPTGTVKLHFERKSARFADLAHVNDVEYVTDNQGVLL